MVVMSCHVMVVMVVESKIYSMTTMTINAILFLCESVLVMSWTCHGGVRYALRPTLLTDRHKLVCHGCHKNNNK